MKNLDQIDPLPEFKGTSVWFTLWEDVLGIPASRRHIKEHNDKVDRSVGDDWRPTDNPLIEVNGKGQMRTKGYQPPEPPETDIPIPCVVEIGDRIKELARTLGGAWAASQTEPENLNVGWKDGWIPHKPGDPMPCERGTRIYYRTGHGNNLESGQGWLAKEEEFGPVIAWKPAT
jgi:hypothetical protein